MKYVVLILAVLVISASAAVAHDVAAAYGAKGMSAHATVAAACETASRKAGSNLVAMLGGGALASVSTGMCICSEQGSAWLCEAEAVGYLAHEHEEMEEMEEQSMDGEES